METNIMIEGMRELRTRLLVAAHDMLCTFNHVLFKVCVPLGVRRDYLCWEAKHAAEDFCLKSH